MAQGAKDVCMLLAEYNSKNASRREVNRNRKFSQAFFSADPVPVGEVMASVENFFGGKSRGFISIFNILLNHSDKYNHVYLSQSTIAKWAGLTREHVNRIIRDLESYGLLLSNYFHMNSKVYKISSYFKTIDVMSRLRHVFSSFKKFFYQNVTQLVPRKYVSTRTIETTKRGSLQRLWNSLTNVVKIDKWKDICKTAGMLQEVPDSLPISKAISDIKFLRLTRWGKIKLSVFPDEAIYEASIKAKSAYGIKNRFNWFFVVCSKYCKARKIPLDWSWYTSLQIFFKMPKDAPMILDTLFEDHSDYAVRPTAQRTRNPKKGYGDFKSTSRNFIEDRKVETNRKPSLNTYVELVKVKFTPEESAYETERRAANERNEKHLANCAKLGGIPPNLAQCDTKAVFADELHA